MSRASTVFTDQPTFGLGSTLDAYAIAILCVVKAHHNRANTSVTATITLINGTLTVNFPLFVVLSDQQEDASDWLSFTSRTGSFFSSTSIYEHKEFSLNNPL